MRKILTYAAIFLSIAVAAQPKRSAATVENLVVDAVSSGLYVYKGVYGRSLLYAVYTVMAVYGYYTWRRTMRLSAVIETTN